MVRTWWTIGQSSFPGRGALPGRTAMGGGVDFMSGFGSPVGIRRARAGTIYSDKTLLGGGNLLWKNFDGAFGWCPFVDNCGI